MIDGWAIGRVGFWSDLFLNLRNFRQSMTDVEISLHRLIRVMEEVGMPVASNINSGLPRDEILQRCQQADISLPQELVDLYCFCDGMHPSLLSSDEGVEYGLDGLYLLLPLDDAIREYEKVKEDALYNDALSVTWFPFLREEGGDYYLVDATAAEAELPSVIWWMMEFAPCRKYSSLQSMFDTLADAYEARAYEFLYELPYLNENLQMSQIAHQRNPNASYWQERIEELTGK